MTHIAYYPVGNSNCRQIVKKECRDSKSKYTDPAYSWTNNENKLTVSQWPFDKEISRTDVSVPSLRNRW